MPKRWFIHYFENGTRVYSEASGQRIANEARQLRNPDGSPFFDHVITYRKRDLGAEFIETYRDRLNAPRGAGYWVWKPQIVKLTLDRMEMGDELMYGDTGCQIRGSLQSLFDLLAHQHVVPFHLEDCHSDRRWTKMDLLNRLGVNDPAIKDSPQRLSGYFLIRKTVQAMQLIDNFAMLAQDLHLSDDSPSVVPEDPKFTGHRHDQSIWSLITKLSNYQAYPDPGWPVETSTTIAAARMT